MGRGLSDLQRYIVKRAASQPRVYYAELLEGYFGWKPQKPLEHWGKTRHRVFSTDGSTETPVELAGNLTRPANRHFSRRAIGEQKYRKAMVSLSRACLRLDRRGLVTWLGSPGQCSAVEITAEGRKLAIG
jgi:hypothetical protein